MRLELLEYVDDMEGFEPYWIYLIIVDNIEVGRLVLRSGDDDHHLYDGHIAYGIDKEYRGHHYSYQACLLLKEIIIKQGKDHVLITCDPGNLASKKIIEKLGCEFIGKKPIPRHLKKYYLKEEKEKLIYKWRLL